MPLWQAAAALSSGTASAAPEASPRRMSRSSSGRWPIAVEEPRVAGLGRAVRDQAMVERAAVDGVQHGGGGGAGIAVEQHRDAAHAGGHDGAGRWPPVPRRRPRPAAPADRGAAIASLWWASASSITAILCASALPLTPVPGPAQSAPRAAEERGAQRGGGRGVGDAHLAQAQHVDAGLGRHHAVGHGVGGAGLVSSPGPCVKSAVGMVEVELVDAQVGVDRGGELVDGGTAVRGSSSPSAAVTSGG